MSRERYTKQDHAEYLAQFIYEQETYDFVGDDIMLNDYYQNGFLLFIGNYDYIISIYEDFVNDEEFINHFNTCMAEYVKIDDDENLSYELTFFSGNERNQYDFIRFNRVE